MKGWRAMERWKGKGKGVREGARPPRVLPSRQDLRVPSTSRKVSPCPQHLQSSTPVSPAPLPQPLRPQQLAAVPHHADTAVRKRFGLRYPALAPNPPAQRPPLALHPAHPVSTLTPVSLRPRPQKKQDKALPRATAQCHCLAEPNLAEGSVQRHKQKGGREQPRARHHAEGQRLFIPIGPFYF